MKNPPWSSALVTGASSGIGKCLADQLAASATRTVVVARRADRLREMAGSSSHVEALPADLLTSDGRAAVIARFNDAADPIDLLINNAGFGISGDVVDVPVDKALEMIDLNVRALVELTRAVLPRMIEARRGWILQVSSVASFQPGPTAAIYSATKAFVTSFTEALHEELRGTGVRVCASCPGYVRTEFQQVSGMGVAEISRVPGFAWLKAEKVAASALRAMAKGQAIDVPGVLYKGLGVVSNTAPRRVARRLMGVAAKT